MFQSENDCKQVNNINEFQKHNFSKTCLLLFLVAPNFTHVEGSLRGSNRSQLQFHAC